MSRSQPRRGNEAQPGHAGAVVFLTGLSGAGKSTIAGALAEELRRPGSATAGREVVIIDGDEIRRHVSADLGYDPASRAANVERAARLAAEVAARGGVAITALIAPFEAARRRARELIEPNGAFVLVHVDVPLAVAEARDPKGLYARARAGEVADFTGITSPYEPPSQADVVIDTSRESVRAAVDRIRVTVEAALRP